MLVCGSRRIEVCIRVDCACNESLCMLMLKCSQIITAMTHERGDDEFCTFVCVKMCCVGAVCV